MGVLTHAESTSLEPVDIATGYGRSWAEATDAESFDRFVDDFHAGRLTPDDFKRFRLQQGIYEQRQTDVQMTRRHLAADDLFYCSLTCNPALVMLPFTRSV